jgi:hypothetical protein
LWSAEVQKPKLKNKNTTKRLAESDPAISESKIAAHPVIPGVSVLLSTAETAAALRVGVGCLEIWRASKRYNLPFTRIGKKVY